MIFMKAKMVLGFSVLSVLAGVALSASSANAQVLCSDLSECRSLRDRVNARIAELEGALPTRIAHGASGQETTFTRDTSIAALGEAWRDPSGMIWGDIVKNDDHSIRYMDQYQASTYCESIGAQLPSREDFARLRGYMGATTAASEYVGTGYTPQVLPNLYRTADGRSVRNYFWSSSVHPGVSNVAYVFDGRTGVIVYGIRDYADYVAVRCVARR
jgi:hypothetical protein